ncbi:transcriptional regulator, marr family [hydrocarbon metagenome]|uniref:Transcriptional regulator, marr family n=1 Tax=hydrocarbon metagenome TaxID=938273 RepID=A0A0W8E1C0_9ZZZZ
MQEKVKIPWFYCDIERILYVMKLEHCINFTLTKAQQAVQQLFKAELAPFGITPGQYAILSCLWDEDGQTPRQLADRLSLDSSSITGILDRVEHKDLIKRQPCPGDRRALHVVLTPKGWELEQSVNQAIIQANKKALAEFESQDADNFRRFLHQLNQGE